MHGDGRDVFRDAGAQRDDAGDVRGVGGLAHAAKDDFVNQRGVEAGAIIARRLPRANLIRRTT